MPDGSMYENQPQSSFDAMSKYGAVSRNDLTRIGAEVRMQLPINRNFTDIQDDLSQLINKPVNKVTQAQEDKLILERARLRNEASDVGVLKSLKDLMIDIQTTYPYGEAFQAIQSINVKNLEREAQGLKGWEPRFEGLINEYRNGALRNMELAYLETTGGNPQRIKQLQREIELLNWGTPPVGLDVLIKNPQRNSQGIIDVDTLARKTAEYQGILPREAYLEEAELGEEFLKTAMRIVPGQEPRFWGLLTNKEKDEWIVRSSLWIIAYKKSVAIDTAELYMKEMQDMAVDMGKWAHKVLFGSIEPNTGKVEFEGMDGVLPAAGIYATIIGDKKFRDYVDKQKPTDKGYQPNLKNVFCEVLTDNQLRQELIKDYGEKALKELQTEEDSLYATCPDSIYPHKDGTAIDAEGFKKLRASIRFFLTTKGRNLLLTDDENKHRGEFFKDKDQALEILKHRARSAEVVAWNYIFAGGLLETFDSRDYRPEGTKRHSPSSFWSLALWTPMHLQERFEAKVLRGNNSPDPEPKEEWARNLGTWAVNNISKGRWQTRNPNGSITINFPKILPNTMFRGALFNKYIYEGGRLPNGKPNDVNDKEALFATFNDIGNDVLFNTDLVSRKDLVARIDWTKISDTPFVSYIWDEIRWADTVQGLFKKGQESKISLPDFAEATRNLRLSVADREKLLAIYFGIDVNAATIKPKENEIAWNLRKRALKEFFPNIFLEK